MNSVVEILSESLNIDSNYLTKLIRKPPSNGMYGEDEPDYCCCIKPLLTKVGSEFQGDFITLLEPKFKRVVVNKGFLNFWLEEDYDAGNIIQQILSSGDNYGQQNLGHGETIVIDFSSPNIAKPFHIGHLRSTIIGNALSNILRFCQYNVVGINYLGDWGKQYGILSIAYDKYGNPSKLKSNPLDHLLEIYIKINKDIKDEAELKQPAEKKARKDQIIETSIDKMAKEYFSQLEQGNPELLEQWKMFRSISIEACQKIYQRLGVKFDVYAGESQVDVNLCFEELKHHIQNGEGDSKYVELKDLGRAILAKKDGSTLYLSRDVAACIERIIKYEPKMILYVVGQQQSVHFQRLFSLMALTNYKTQLGHVGFGKVIGLSTREGNIILLEEVLDTAKTKILSLMISKAQKHNRPLPPNSELVADILGISAVVVNDLANNRLNDIAFNWDKVLAFEGYTGPYIQYTHARLHKIVQKHILQPDIDYSSLVEKEFIRTVKLLSNFDQIIKTSAQNLETTPLVQYLFAVCSNISTCYKKYHVDNQLPNIAQPRLACFTATKIVIANGLKLLGLPPVECM